MNKITKQHYSILMTVYGETVTPFYTSVTDFTEYFVWNSIRHFLDNSVGITMNAWKNIIERTINSKIL